MSRPKELSLDERIALIRSEIGLGYGGEIAIKALIRQEVAEIIGPDEEAHLYGSDKQLAMDADDKWMNDLAIALNDLRAHQRTIAERRLK